MTSSNKPSIIIGIDPGTRITGYGLIRVGQQGFEPLDFGCVRPPPSANLSDRYLIIFESLEELIEKYQPDTMAIETQFISKNPQSALKVGTAFGVSMISAKRRGLKVYGYSPREVKCAVTGTGKADKQQVQLSISRRLSLSQLPEPEDAADALAIAICHAQTMQNKIKSLTKKEL